MFNALDHLDGLQLLGVLSPIVLIMTFIRKREDKANSIQLEGMNSLQKGWVFLNLLSPGLAAKVLTLLESEERERVIQAGGGLRGTADAVALPVVDIFFKSGGVEGGVPSKDIDEICRFLNLKYQDTPDKLVKSYRKAYL